MNLRRGHESQLHLKAKASVANLFAAQDWSVFPEQCDTDVLVMHTRTGFLAAIEVESSPRNVVRNIERNRTNGCHAVAVVSLTRRYDAQIKTKAARCDGTIRFFTNTSLLELHQWIEQLAKSNHVKPEKSS